VREQGLWLGRCCWHQQQYRHSLLLFDPVVVAKISAVVAAHDEQLAAWNLSVIVV